MFGSAGTGGSFSFGAATSPGQKPAAFGGFGATTQAPAPAAGFGAFGATTQTPAPGAGFGAFGAAPTPATGFGAFGATPAPAAGGFGFGATATSGTSSSLFGSSLSSNQQTTSGGLFGAKPAGTGFNFGGTPAAAPTFGAGFGTGTAGFGMGTTQSLTPTPTSELEADLLKLLIAYSDKVPTAPAAAGGFGGAFGTTPAQAAEYNKDCRFKHLFYNVVPSSERGRYVCPPFVDKRMWELAERENPDPDNLAPCPVVGIEALKERAQHQHQHSETLQNMVQQLQHHLQNLEQLSSQNENGIQKGFDEHRRLCNRFLQVLRKLEVLRGMYLPLQPEEREFHLRLEALSNSLTYPIQQLATLQAFSSQVGRTAAFSEKLKDTDLATVHSAMQHQREGLAHLTQILKKDLRDAKIIQDELAKKNKKQHISSMY